MRLAEYPVSFLHRGAVSLTWLRGQVEADGVAVIDPADHRQSRGDPL
jgi:hypothetical protein